MKLRSAWVLVLAVATAFAGCGEEKKRRNKGDDDDGNGGAGSSAGVGAMGGDGGAGAAGGGQTDPDGPQFLSFETNVDTLYEGESVIFTAVLTDPDGVEDVIGGSLLDDDGGSYGAFVTSGQEGSYEMSVSWSAIQQVAPIEFDYGSAMARTFVAEFYDADGHVSTRNVVIDLTCSNGWAGCDGNCLDTMSDDFNCGSCGNDCASGDLCVLESFCQAGSCTAGEQVDCSWMNGECSTGSCNPQTGECVEQNVANNTPCDDLDACTTNDVCSAGSCAGTPVMGGGTVFAEDFSDNLAGWQLGTEWAIGAATASSGQSSLNPDPGTDHSPTVDDGVAGVVIGGNASIAQHGYYYLTSPIVNTQAVQGPLTLSYYRWLNSDYTPYMHNVVEVFNGVSWVNVWQSGGTATQDASWTQMTHDITAYKNTQMRVRFGFNVGSANAYVCSQWNLDDVSISNGGGMCQ
jgi:hypothetical protein